MIEIDDLKAYLGLGELTADEVIALTDLEKRAVAFVETQTGRYFGPDTTFTKYLDGNGMRALWLTEAPDSITTLRERAVTDDTWTAVLSTDTDGWELRDYRILRKNGHVWRYGYEYEVVYDFGYAAGQEPGDIRELVMDLVKLKWDTRQRESGIQREQVGPESVTYAVGSQSERGLMQIPWVRDTIDHWRWRRAA